MRSLLHSQRTAESNRKRVITPEYREKLRKSHLGQVSWNKGITGKDSHSYGRVLSEETRRKISEAHKGEKSYLWKGGVTEINKQLRRGIEYRNWRRSVFERDNYTCQAEGCGARSGNGKRVNLQADHIKPFSLFPELRLDVSNGRTLCTPCHRKTETFGGKILRLKSL